MKKLKNLTVIFGVLTLFVLGCGDNQNPLDNSDLSYSNPPSLPLILPPGAVLNSATLMLYVEDHWGTGIHNINIHRVTAPWDEATVTYNNFGGSYDPVVSASFISAANGWHTCDITSLVQSWLDGTYPDYGLLMEQPEADWTRFASSEYANPAWHPSVEICYTTGGPVECITIQRNVYGTFSDANISSITPDTPLGNQDLMYTNTVGERIKQILIKFDAEVEPDTSFSQLLPTDTECADFLGGTPDLVMTVNPRGKIAPGGFFLYNLIQEPGDVTIEISMTVDPAGEPVPIFMDAKVYIDGCENISNGEGVMISYVGGVVTIFVPAFWVNQSQDNTLITRVHYKSPTGQAGTEFCFNTAVNGVPSSQACVTVIPQ
jgi:hypothetical protein